MLVRGEATPWKYTDDYYKEYTRTTWNDTAEEYHKFQRLLEPYGFDLINRLELQVREKVLDLATGSGEPALSIARLVGPDGEVVGVDLSEKMVHLATRLSQQRRLTNVSFKVMDAEKLEFPDNTFDVVVSRFGFQIFTNPEEVAREARRVLKPRGRIGISVWGTAEKAAAIHVLVGAMLEFAEPDESGYLPTPYELGGPGELVKFLEDAGFSDAKEEHRTHRFVAPDADAYLDVLLRATPLGHSMGEEDPSVQQKIRRKARENLKAWTTRNGVSAPCECVIVTARK